MATPGCDSRRHGWSATINENGNGVLYVHSTSTEFEARKAYTKFSAFAILEHGGDFSAAASELRKQGYGSQAETGYEIRHDQEREQSKAEARRPLGNQMAAQQSLVDCLATFRKWLPIFPMSDIFSSPWRL